MRKKREEKKRMELKGFDQSSAGVFRQKKDYRITFPNGESITFPLKSLPTNVADIISDALPYPAAPKKFDRETKTWGQDLSSPEFLKEKAKIDAARTYALVIYGIDETLFPIQGNTLLEKIDTLIKTEIPLGYFSKIANAVGELSGISSDEFR